MTVLRWCPSLRLTQYFTSMRAWALPGHRGPRCCRSGPIRPSRLQTQTPCRIHCESSETAIAHSSNSSIRRHCSVKNSVSSVTFNDKCQIVRWIDYWDGRSSQLHLPIGTLGPYPPDFHDGVVNASATIKKVAKALQDAFSAGDAAKAAQLFTPDAVFEDMALHTRVEGQLQIQRYLTRGLTLLPYGPGASVAHVVGSDQGGGYEWRAAMSAIPLVRGNTAIELDEDGKITRFTTIYDSFQFPDTVYQSLVQLGAEK